MLSRLALNALPRAGWAAAASVSRQAVASTPLTARTAAASSVWMRSYAKNSKPTPPPKKQPADDKPATSSQQPDKDAAKPADGESAAAAPEAEPVEQIPFHKLPDLTQGIPSTLEQEMSAGRDGNPEQPSYLQSVPEGESSGRRDRRDEYVSSNEQYRRRLMRILLMGTGGGTLLGMVYLGRNWDDEEEAKRHPDIPNGWGLGLWWSRLNARWTDSVSYYQDPAFDKLLPDPDPSFERPYTLCLSLDDLLVHSEWTRDHGWRVAKRPGMDYFVRYLSQYYELVLFTTVPFAMGEPLVRKLDPFRFIMWPLYREATKYEDGEIVKDLSYLNRDLSKVIIIDTNASHVRKQPENAIVLDPWKGNAKDQDLVGLIPFLEYIHTMQVDDVRKTLKSFEGKHIPTEFARREAIARAEFNKRHGVGSKKSGGSSSGMGALGSLFGLKPANMSMTMAPEGEQNPAEAFAQGKMLQDIARERGQRNYELLEKEIRENGEKWLKEEQVAMEKAQQEAMNSMMGSFSGMFGSGDSKPAEKK